MKSDDESETTETELFKYLFEFLSYSIFEVIMTVCWLGSVSFYRVLVLIALHFGNSLQKSESLTAF